MTPICLNANGNFRPRVLPNGERRGLSNYFAFTHGVRPSWWRDEFASGAAGDVIGVMENEEGERVDALVIAEQGLVVLASAGAWRVRYDQIRAFEPPGMHGKEPVPDDIVAFCYSGDTVRIPARHPPGAAYSFYRFLLYAVTQSKKSKAIE
jgi:hypothetical protein